MHFTRTRLAAATLTAGALLGLAGCYSSRTPLSADFGDALEQNLAAQVADPDAVYKRTEEPASNGQRAAAAADRYNRGEVTPPQSLGTSTVRTGNNAGGSAGGGGGGAAGGAR